MQGKAVEPAAVRRCAEQFRAAVVSGPPEFYLPYWTDFPDGCCGDAALLLGMYLANEGFGEPEYVAGNRGEWSHAWVELGGLVVDVTADQFDDEDQAVVVRAAPSAWHSGFEEHTRHAASILAYDDATRVRLERAYRLIRTAIGDAG